MAGANAAAAVAGGVASVSPGNSTGAEPTPAGGAHAASAALMVQAYGLSFLGQACRQGWLLQGAAVPPGLLPAVHSAVGMVASFLEQHQAAAPDLSIVACPGGGGGTVGDTNSPCCALAHTCPGAHLRMGVADLAAAASAAAVLLLWCGGPTGVNSVDASGSGMLHRLSAAGCGQVLVAYMAAAGPHLDLKLRDGHGADAATVARCDSWGLDKCTVFCGRPHFHPAHAVASTA